MELRAILCSQNPGKLRELEKLFPMLSLAIMDQELSVPEETGATLLENALIKARHGAYTYPRTWVIADDSGLVVDALDGAPGVYSARWAGTHGDHAANNVKLLRELEGIADRRAGFMCTLVAISPSGQELVATGEVRGVIVDELRGVAGFGYDPLFVPDGYDRTFGELDLAIKQTLSHRARAAAKLERMMLELVARR